MSTGILWDKRYLLHDTGLYHPERPDRLRAIHEKIESSDLASQLERIEPRLATEDDLSLVHSLDHVRAIEKTKGMSTHLDPDTVSSPKSYEAALLAVGGLLQSVDQVVQGPLDNAFAFVRPPGHHAEPERSMGFCIFNNVAIAAEYARKHYGIERIFIMDYDVHHGNGTQWAFYDRPDIFYCSTHRFPFYPGSGDETEVGEGKGRDYTRNIIFSGGEGDEEYARVFEDIVLPIARDFKPGLILLSAGYDAHVRVPLGGMSVTAEGFAHMTRGLKQVADEVCEGKLVAVLEGGYDLTGLADSVAASLKTLL